MRAVPRPHTERTGLNLWASERELNELAKTKTLEAIAKKTGRKPESILKTAKRLGIKIRGRQRGL
jgi:ribosomal protein L32E